LIFRPSSLDLILRPWKWLLNFRLLFLRPFIWLLSVVAVFWHGTLNPTCYRFCLSYFIRSLILNVEMRLSYYRWYLYNTIYLWQRQKLWLCLFHHWVLFRRVSLKIIQSDLTSVTNGFVKLVLTLHKSLFPSTEHRLFIVLRVLFAIFLRWKYSIDSQYLLSSFSRVIIECSQKLLYVNFVSLASQIFQKCLTIENINSIFIT
jgi:hypothetical protein